MPELVLLGLRVGLLVLLWIFVLLAVRAARTDLFGAGRPRKEAAPSRPAGPAPAPAPLATPAPARSRVPAPGVRSLVVTSGPLSGTTVTLGDSPVTIGRSHDSTLVLADDYTSSRHARLTPRGADWWLEDLGSTNGTYLDRTRLTEPVPVPPGVPVRIGTTTLELRR